MRRVKKKANRILAIMCLFTLLASPLAYAEEDPVLVYVTELIQEKINVSDKVLSGYMDIAKYSITDSNVFEVAFDWRDGYEEIRILCCRSARLYSLYPVNTLEKIECLLFILSQYNEIKNLLPSEVDFNIEIFEADGSKIRITSSNYKSYIKRFKETLGIL